MRTRRVLTIALPALLACAVLGGCGAQAPSRVTYNGEDFLAGSTTLASLTTLGAGDSLGAEIYRQDVYLAYLDTLKTQGTATAGVLRDVPASLDAND